MRIRAGWIAAGGVAAADGGCCPGADDPGPGPDGRRDQEARPTRLRRRHRHPRLRIPGQQRRLARLRRRLLPRHRRRRARRPGQGPLRADHDAHALHRPAIGRDRRAGPRQHADDDPQPAAPSGRGRHQLLRRPGLPRVQEARRRQDRRSERRDDLHADRRDARTQHRRLRARPTAPRSARCCSRNPTRRSPPWRPAAATATPTTPAAWPPSARR